MAKLCFESALTCPIEFLWTYAPVFHGIFGNVSRGSGLPNL